MKEYKKINIKLAYDRLEQLDPTIFFNQNEGRKNLLKKLAKSLLKILGWPFLMRQVIFNTSNKQILQQIIQTLEILQHEFEKSKILFEGEEDPQNLAIQRAFAEIRRRDQQFFEFKDQVEKYISSAYRGEATIAVQKGKQSQTENILQALQRIFILKALPELRQPGSISILITGSTGRELGVELSECGYQVMLSHKTPFLTTDCFDCSIALWDKAYLQDSYSETICTSLNQIRNSLKPDGRFIVTLPSGNTTDSSSQVLQAQIAKLCLSGFVIERAQFLLFKEDGSWQIVEEATLSDSVRLDYYSAFMMLTCAVSPI